MHESYKCLEIPPIYKFACQNNLLQITLEKPLVSFPKLLYAYIKRQHGRVCKTFLQIPVGDRRDQLVNG